MWDSGWGVCFEMVVPVSSSKYVAGVRIRLPRRSLDDAVRGYEIKDGNVNCFYADDLERLAVNQFEVPYDAREMKFAKMIVDEEERVGWPVYYGDKGNLLKIGNH